VFNEARAQAASEGHDTKHYLKVMEKVVNTGEAYIEKETKRWVTGRNRYSA
jgi:hypothetical protein